MFLLNPLSSCDRSSSLFCLALFFFFLLSLFIFIFVHYQPILNENTDGFSIFTSSSLLNGGGKIQIVVPNLFPELNTSIDNFEENLQNFDDELNEAEKQTENDDLIDIEQDETDENVQATDSPVTASTSPLFGKLQSIRELLPNLLAKNSTSPNLHPYLIFIKGLKVGGTSIAYALNRIAVHYKIDLAPVTLRQNKAYGWGVGCQKIHNSSLYFHHGYRNTWQHRCFPPQKTRFITLLREPISQALSWESMQLNQAYFLHYPSDKPCPIKRSIDIIPQNNGTVYSKNVLMGKLKTVKDCLDIPYRKNLTFLLVADQIRKFLKIIFFVDVSSSFD